MCFSILPDNTWLQQLDVRGVEVSMQGNTGSSAKLIGLFEQSALLENANFKSPLVKVQGGRAQGGEAQGSEERFKLTAGVKAIDPAKALAEQRDVQENKKPASAAGNQPAKP